MRSTASVSVYVCNSYGLLVRDTTHTQYEGEGEGEGEDEGEGEGEGESE